MIETFKKLLRDTVGLIGVAEPVALRVVAFVFLLIALWKFLWRELFRP
jgi:hypothetical protein